jgi:hypothetical protein
MQSVSCSSSSCFPIRTLESPTHKMFDELEVLLCSAKRLSKDCLPTSIKDEIRVKINEFLSLEPKNEDLLIVLNLLSENVFSDTSFFFTKILGRILRARPELNEYFIEADEDPIISIQGMTLLIDLFESEGSIERGKITTAFSTDLESIIKGFFIDESRSISKGYIIAAPADFSDPHLSPVYFSKKDEKLKILVTDSRGHNFDLKKAPEYLCEALKTIISILDFDIELASKVEVYSYKNKRQNDCVTCPIFSFLDLKSMIEMEFMDEDNIFDFIERSSPKEKILLGEPTNEELEIYEFGMLPSEMMKPTQSYTLIRNYIEKSPSRDGSVTPISQFKFSGEGSPFLSTPESFETLEETATTYRCATPRKSGFENKYADSKRYAFTTKIISYYIKGKTFFNF